MSEQQATDAAVNVNPEVAKTAEVPAGEALPAKDYDEFEVGEHQVPWFLWVFFLLIVSWASVSWIKFFNY